MRIPPRLGVTLFAFLLWTNAAFAQHGAYVGGVFGISTLSADARSLSRPDGIAISLYKPENGPAVNLFAGVHLNDFLTLQGNFVWNRNRLTTTSAALTASGLVIDEQVRNSTQRSAIGDVLLYFRNRGDWARPYLSAGAGLIDFQSREPFSSAAAGLRVAVGIDLRVQRYWSFRYSFSETLRRNPVSARLSPPGERNLANFQNLFGIVRHF